MEDKSKTGISPWPWYAVKGTEFKWICGEWRQAMRHYIEDDEGFRIAKLSRTDSDDGGRNANVMAAAPELRAALEDIVKNACRMCETELKVAMHGTKKPCEDGRPCPRGMDDAKKAIAKALGKEEK